MSEFDPQSPDFPPEPAPNTVTYGGYLKIQELLDLQQPLSEPRHHDETLFIIIHQVYELWFKQLLHEMDAAVEAFGQGAVLRAHKIFRRVVAIQRVLNVQLTVLETMTPQDFNVFRSLLNPASGFQSAQCRELEAISGIKDPRFNKLHAADSDALARIERRLADATVYDAFLGLLITRGFDVPATQPAFGSEDSERIVAAMRTLYMESEAHYDLYLTCEHLIEYDELFQIWRFSHIKMVERTIGLKWGTGGSPGVPYLKSTLAKRFFPELWEVRTRLA